MAEPEVAVEGRGGPDAGGTRVIRASDTWQVIELPIQKFGVKLTSHLRRSTARALRRAAWREYNGTRMPRDDDEIVCMWLLRAARRRGVITVDVPEWQYDPGWKGPAATQYASVRVIEPQTPAQRTRLTGIRVAKGTGVIRLPDPDRPPQMVAVFDG